MGTPKAGLVRVRAATVRVRDQFVMARFGKLARERFRAAASQPLRSVLLTPGDIWVDFALFLEATQLVIDLFGDGDIETARRIGAFGAEANMGVWRSIVYRVLSPRRVLDLAAVFWSHHYDGGRLSTVLDGKNGIRIRLEDFPEPDMLHCLSIEGWSKRIIEIGKPKHVSLVMSACRTRGDPMCEWVGDWE